MKKFLTICLVSMAATSGLLSQQYSYDEDLILSPGMSSSSSEYSTSSPYTPYGQTTPSNTQSSTYPSPLTNTNTYITPTPSSKRVQATPSTRNYNFSSSQYRPSAPSISPTSSSRILQPAAPAYVPPTPSVSSSSISSNQVEETAQPNPASVTTPSPTSQPSPALRSRHPSLTHYNQTDSSEVNQEQPTSTEPQQPFVLSSPEDSSSVYTSPVIDSRGSSAPSNERSFEPTPSSPISNTSSSTSIQSMNALNNAYRLRIGDILSFRVVEDRDPPQQLMVTDSGEIEVPLIGRVKASGKTSQQLAYVIKELLEKDFFYQATVLIGVDQQSKFRGRVWVVGQVRMVGPQDIPSDENYTVSKAILNAGGFTDFANKRKVQLIRKGKENTEGEKEKAYVDLVEILEKGNVSNDPIVQDNDLIIVPQRLINF